MMASSLMPIAGSSLVYGSDNQARTVHTDEPELNTRMLEAARRLNIKPHRVGREGGSVLASCADVEVHRGMDARWYLVDTARVFPPEAPQLSVPAILLRPGTSIGSPMDVSRRHFRQEVNRCADRTGAGREGSRAP